MKNSKPIIFLLIIAILLLAYIAFKPKPVVAPLEQGTNTSVTEVKDTYTYTKHGFSIELPKGFVPKETQGEGGPGLHISLPGDSIVYYPDIQYWRKYVLPGYSYIKDEKIGQTTFKVYSDGEFVIYWYERGNVGYELHGNKKSFETFKFVGWPQVEGSKEDLVSFSIKPGQEVSGKMTVMGVLKGGYFFEGNLPISILDSNQNPTSYGPGHGMATTDWMTAGPVSFSALFDFSVIPKGSYYIQITQDDPSDGESGRPIKFVIIPIVVK